MGCNESKTVDCTDEVSYVSALVNDPDNRRWGRSLIECALNEARALVSLVRPDLSVKTVDIEIVAGVAQQAPEDCSKIVSVVGIVDAKGRVKGRPKEGVSKIARWFEDVCCDADPAAAVDNYEAAAFELDGFNKGLIYLDPPVPPGFNGKLRVNCYDACAGSSDLCQMGTPVFEFVLYRLLSSEEQNPASIAAAGNHLQMFSQLLTVNLQVIERFMENANASAST